MILIRGLERWIGRATFVAGLVVVLAFIANGRGQGQTSTTHNQSSGNVSGDIASFNRFLTEHPDVEKQLETNPSLIRDPNFLTTQPALKAFLSDHPDVRAQLEQSPIDFVRRENGSGTTVAVVKQNSVNGLDDRELGRIDEFFDEHRDIEQQLELNPWLVNDPNFMGQHRDLQNFLNTHSAIRQEFTHDPGNFMQQEHRADSAASGNRGITNREIGQMDQFLDEHRDVAQQLQQQPVLINDSKYLSQHADLSLFVNEHPAVRLEFTEHPGLFVYSEKQAVAAGTASANPPNAAVNSTLSTNAAPSAISTTLPPVHPSEPPKTDMPAVKSAPIPVDRNVEVANAETTRVSQFLDDHPNIEKDLNKNPWLINQSKYLKHHKELARFLQEHPQIQYKVAQDPQFFTHWKSFGTPATQDSYQPAMYSRSDTEMHRGPDVSSSDLAEFDRFLSKHKKTAKELENDPALVTSQHYIDHNKDLRKFFQQHGQILEEFRQNPRNFMQREDELRAQLR